MIEHLLEVVTEDVLSAVRGLLLSCVTAAHPESDYTAADHDLAAQWVVEAELLGLHAFGTTMLLRELDRLTDCAGRSGGAAEHQPMRSSIDASGIPGQLALARAVRRALSASSGPNASGTTLIGLRNVGALGVIGSAARTLALGGLVGVVMANSPAAVAPWGGNARAIGTNPLAVAVPRQGQPPLVLDFATSPTTLATLRAARELGTEVPAPGGFSLEGAATTDPNLIDALAPAGKISSLAGLAIEMIVGVGIGAQDESRTPDGGRGALVLALAPAAFGAGDPERLGRELSQAWAGAGGHIPARFDTLPAALTDLPHTLSLPADTFARLTESAHNHRSTT